MTAAAPAIPRAEPKPVLKAPFPWFGGKSKAAELIWSRLGDVGNYVEPFAGSLAVLLARPHEPRIETINDRDCYLANFWRAVHSDPEKVAHAADWPVNECDLRARHKWLTDQPKFRENMLSDPDYFDPKIAGWWAWGISQWIGAGWCSRPEWEGRGQGGRAPRGLNASIHLSSTMGVHHNDGQNKRPVINSGGRGVTLLPEKRPHLGNHAPGGVHRKMPKRERSKTGAAQNEALASWMLALAGRLRRVRVCCGDWARIVTPSCTWKLGGGQLTGILLDPPYSHTMRDNRLYSIEQDVGAAVRKWALENGANPRLRIALCGLEHEHRMAEGWTVEYWRAPRGYSNKGKRREVVWFSPYCLKGQDGLFGMDNEGVAL
jgi:hypothetical protein